MAEKKLQENNPDFLRLKQICKRYTNALVTDGITSIQELITYFPKGYIDRNSAGSVDEIIYKQNIFETENNLLDFSLTREVIIIGQIVNSNLRELRYRKKMLTLSVKDMKGQFFEIVFFHFAESYEKKYKVGQILSVSGKPNILRGKVSFAHPEIEIIDAEDINFYMQGGLIPKYKITESMRRAKLTNRILRNIIAEASAIYINEIKETLPEYILEKYKFPNLKQTIQILHTPPSQEIAQRAMNRIKFEELLYYQMNIRLQRKKIVEQEEGILITKKSKLARALYDKLPFSLSSDQKKVLREFAKDFASGKAMNRLLQGDVGSGKTIVAILTMLMIIDEGFQVAMMAPTEILAEQHFHTVKKMLEELDIEVVQLVGGLKKKMKAEIIEQITSGKANIIIGTHAMFQSDVMYNNLGLIVIDEQHRFGVMQRAELIKLAKESMKDSKTAPHILYMTATPIPRTLTMTVYGDLDVSVIKTMPKNRLPIITKVTFENQRQELFRFINKEIKEGRQAYIVFPLVEKSEKLEELKSAVEHYEIIKNEVFPHIECGLLHGQMFWYEKEEVMTKFLNKEFQILVATTVVEVGIDVPNATIMMVENAERFGLSQLHQLRGRVGRGSLQSYCFLMTKNNFQFQFAKNKNAEDEKNAAIVRLKTMQATNDGFKIAEVDVQLRGPGDIMGTKQSGLPEFKYADIVQDIEILSEAKNAVNEIFYEDENLSMTKNILLRKQMIKIVKGGNNLLAIA